MLQLGELEWFSGVQGVVRTESGNTHLVHCNQRGKLSIPGRWSDLPFEQRKEPKKGQQVIFELDSRGRVIHWAAVEE